MTHPTVRQIEADRDTRIETADRRRQTELEVAKRLADAQYHSDVAAAHQRAAEQLRVTTPAKATQTPKAIPQTPLQAGIVADGVAAVAKAQARPNPPPPPAAPNPSLIDHEGWESATQIKTQLGETP